jgi:hypothetical protein
VASLMLPQPVSVAQGSNTDTSTGTVRSSNTVGRLICNVSTVSVRSSRIQADTSIVSVRSSGSRLMIALSASVAQVSRPILALAALEAHVAD